METPLHVSVLPREAVDALCIKPDGIYVDATYGRGGHSGLILDQLSTSGKLLVIDKDPQAIADAERRFKSDHRVTVVHSSFAELERILATVETNLVDGILLDLGVSSPQLDDAERGFSFMRAGPLDMRMNPEVGQSAAAWLNVEDQSEISRVLFQYGEEKQARKIAKAIIERRAQKPFATTTELAELVAATIPKKKAAQSRKHPATQTFQAIRIYINAELNDLETVLPASVSCLRPGGRLVVISFHSLEDRTVKRFLRQQSTPKLPPKRIPIADLDYGTPLRLIGKAIKPSAVEVGANPRARSSVMRVAERTEVAYAR